MPTVFVNYRKGDEETVAAVIADRLGERIGRSEVFLAPQSVPPGSDFPPHILHAVRTCPVLLVFLGPNWLAVENEDGSRKLDDPEDWVRKEIAEALRCEHTIVIVLVGDARMPSPDELPDDIAAMSTRQYRRLSYRSASQDTTRLVTELLDLPELGHICLPGSETPGGWCSRWAAEHPGIPVEIVLAGRHEHAHRLRDDATGQPTVVGVAAESMDEARVFAIAALRPLAGEGHRVRVVADSGAWTQYVASTRRSILVPVFDKPDISRAVQEGHSVVLPSDARAGVRLPRLDLDHVAAAFEEAGCDRDEAARLARLARDDFPGLLQRTSRGSRASAGSGQGAAGAMEPLELASAVSRGPLRHLGLDGYVTRAEALLDTRPAEAAELYGSVVEKLLDAGFVEPATPLRQAYVNALVKAGQADTATTVALEMFWRHVNDRLEAPELAVPASIRTSGVLGPDLARALDLAQTVPALLSGRAAGATERFATAFDALSVGDPHRLDAAVLLSETALASHAQTAVEDRLETLLELAGTREETGSAAEKLVVRLNICLAEITGDWEPLHRRARGEFASWFRPWATAREARWHAVRGDYVLASDLYTDAIENATVHRMYEEAAAWLYALRAVKGMLGVLFVEGDQQHSMARHLRTAGASRLPGSRVIVEQALRSAASRKPIRALRRLSQWRWHAYMSGSFAEELETTREIGSLLAANDKPLAGLRELVWAGARTKAVQVAQALPEEPVRWSADSTGPTAAQHSAALAAVAACADLLDDDDVPGWIELALDVVHGKGPRSSTFIDDLVRYAIGALAALAPCLTQEQASTLLDTLAPLVPRDSDHYRPSDRDHASLLVGIAANQSTLAEPALRQLLDGLPHSQAFAGKALGQDGAPLLQAHADLVSERLDKHAADRNHWSCVALAMVQRPTDAACAYAKHAVERVVHRPDPVAGVYSVYGNLDGTVLLAELCQPELRADLATALLRQAGNSRDVAANRRSAIAGLARLARLIDEDQRRQLFDVLLPYCGGEGDGSISDGILASMKHPLSAIRFDEGPTTLMDEAVRACAYLAVTDQDREAVRVQALRLLATPVEVDVPVIVDALNVATRQVDNLPPELLATHPNPHMQALAAVMWANEPDGPELGARLASSPHRIVRTSLARQLTLRAKHQPARTLLAVDPRRSVRALSENTR